MSGIMLVAAYLAAVNPLRTRLGMPESGDAGRGRTGVVGLGAGMALMAVATLAGGSGTILSIFEVTPEMFRVAAGIVVAVAAIAILLRHRPAAEPEASGWRAALWPVFFPRLLGAELVALALATGSTEGAAASVAAAALAFGLVVVLGAVRRGRLGDRLLLNTGRLVTVWLMVVAVYLIVDGIRAV